MKPSMVYAWIFISTVFLSWIAGYVIVRKWPGGKQLSMSGHGASHRHAYAIFAATLTFTAITTYLFMVKWLLPTFSLQGSLKLVALLFAILQVVTAWAPDIPGIKRTVHRWAAWTVAGLMPVELVYLITSPQVSTFARVFAALVVIGMLVVLHLQFIRKSIKAYFLIYQAAYIVACQLAITVAILVRK